MMGAREQLVIIQEMLENVTEHYGPGHLHCSACEGSITSALTLVLDLLSEQQVLLCL